jgi:hypothetical protein
MWRVKAGKDRKHFAFTAIACAIGGHGILNALRGSLGRATAPSGADGWGDFSLALFMELAGIRIAYREQAGNATKVPWRAKRYIRRES